MFKTQNAVLCAVNNTIGLFFQFFVNIIMLMLSFLFEFLDISKCFLMIYQFFLSNFFNVLHSLLDGSFLFIFGSFVKSFLDGIALFLYFSFGDFLHIRFDTFSGFCFLRCDSNLQSRSGCSFY